MGGSFDPHLTYGSEVNPGTGPAAGWSVIRFFDRLLHRGERLEHVCEQWVRAGPDQSGQLRLNNIRHHDLPGERERLEAFKAKHSV